MTTFNPVAVGSVNVNVTRPGTGGTYVLGVYQVPVSTTFTIKANIQPADSEDLLKLPELERTKDVIIVFTPTVIKAGNQATQQKADVISWQGYNYEVYRVATYAMGVLDHTEAICVRVSP
jgi:hypothetical protein